MHIEREEKTGRGAPYNTPAGGNTAPAQDGEEVRLRELNSRGRQTRKDRNAHTP